MTQKSDKRILLREKLKKLKKSVFLFSILLLIVLNLADLFFSLRAFSVGAYEVNPFMRWLFETDVVLGSILKVTLVSLAAILLFNFRASMLARRGATLATTLYAGVFVYHLYFFRF